MRKQQHDVLGLGRLVTAVWLLGLGLIGQPVVADTLDNSWCWRTCRVVGDEVTHSVMLRDSVTGSLRQRKLAGPFGVALTASSDSCLTGYRIDAAVGTVPAGRLRLTLPGGGEPLVVLVGLPRAALLPAQLLRDGPPTGGLGNVVYEEREILTVENGVGDRWASICLPVEYRHHFERLRPPDDAAVFILSKAVKPAAAGEIVGLVDDLGTSQIRLGNSQQTVMKITKWSVVE